MSNLETINLAPDANADVHDHLPEVLNGPLAFQLLQGMARIEHRLTALEGRLGSPRARTDKPKIRPQLTAQLLKGWVSDAEIMEKAGWQREGVRSFISKVRGMGFSVETDLRGDVTYYRIAK